MLAALPKVGETLVAAAQPPCTAWNLLSSCVLAAGQITQLLSITAAPREDAIHPAEVMCSAAALPAWCHAAAAALRWLPSVAAAVAEAAQQPHSAAAAALVQRLQTHAGLLSSSAVMFATRVSISASLCVQLLPLSGPACNPAVMDDCLQALRELHTAACRLVHRALLGSPPLVFGAYLGNLPSALYTLAHAPFHAAALAVIEGMQSPHADRCG